MITKAKRALKPSSYGPIVNDNRTRTQVIRDQKAASRDRIRARKGYAPCPRCKRHLKNPEYSHYSDTKNKIPCLTDEQKMGIL